VQDEKCLSPHEDSVDLNPTNDVMKVEISKAEREVEVIVVFEATGQTNAAAAVTGSFRVCWLLEEAI